MPPKARKKKADLEQKIEPSDDIQEQKLESKVIPSEQEQKKHIKTFTPFEHGLSKELNSEKDVARIKFVLPEERITDNVIRPPELARLLAYRAELYSKNQISFVTLTTETNAEQVAIKELKMRKFPLDLVRIMTTDKDGNQIAERWDPNTMTLPALPILE